MNPINKNHNQTILQEFNIQHPYKEIKYKTLGELKKMAKLNEVAQNYEQPKTKVVSDLTQIPTDVEVYEKTVDKKDGDSFTYKYIEIAGEEYRVPNIVLGQLKTQMESNPDLKLFKVDKKGEGLKTVYTVIPM